MSKERSRFVQGGWAGPRQACPCPVKSGFFPSGGSAARSSCSRWAMQARQQPCKQGAAGASRRGAAHTRAPAAAQAANKGKWPDRQP